MKSQCDCKMFGLQSANIYPPQWQQWHSTAENENKTHPLADWKRKKYHNKINVSTQLCFLLPFPSQNVGVHNLNPNIRRPGNLNGDLHTYHPKSSEFAKKPVNHKLRENTGQLAPPWNKATTCNTYTLKNLRLQNSLEKLCFCLILLWKRSRAGKAEKSYLFLQ